MSSELVRPETVLERFTMVTGSRVPEGQYDPAQDKWLFPEELDIISLAEWEIIRHVPDAIMAAKQENSQFPPSFSGTCIL